MHTLTREEISEFTKAFGGDKRKPKRSREVRDYDLTNPGRNVSKIDLRAAERILKSMADAWSSTLSRALRVPVALRLDSPEQSTSVAYSESLPVDSVLVTLRDGGGTDLHLNLPSDLALTLVNRLSGGRGEIHQRRSKLTHIEMFIVERFAGLLCSNVSELAATFGSSDFVVAGVTAALRISNSALMAAPGEWTMNGKMYNFSVALPSEMVAKAAESFAQAHAPESNVLASADIAKLENTFGLVPIPVSVELGSARVNMQDVKDMQIGDVIRLNHPVSESVSVKIGKRPVFNSRAGVVGDKLAVRIGTRMN